MTSPYTTAGGAKSNDPTPNTAVHRAVDRLAAELNDGVGGFEAAGEAATEDELATMIEKMADKRRARVADIEENLAELGRAKAMD